MIELRTAGDRREIIGLLVPYGADLATGPKSAERFAPGVFDGTDPTTVHLFVEHPEHRGAKVPVGVAVELDEQPDGLHGVFKVARTGAGDEALELVRSGVLTDLSIGFATVPGGSRPAGRVTEHIRALLDHVALTVRGAIPHARVLATRTANPPGTDDTENDDTENDDDKEGGTVTAPDPTPLPDPDPDDDDNGNGSPERGTGEYPGTGPELLHRMASLEDTVRRYGAGLAPAPVTPKLDPVAWFRGEILAMHHRDARHRVNVRALADVTGELGGPATDLSAFVVEEFLGTQLINVLDTRRPVFSAMGRFTMPKSGYARIPIVTTHTKVGPRTGQKDPANTRAMAATTQPYEAQWFDGAVDVALEWLATAEGPALALVWDDLLGQYAQATELYAEQQLAAAGTLTGATLPIDTYENFAGAVAAQSIEVRKATGSPASFLAVPNALWPNIISFTDSTGRRVFATGGATNADAGVSLTAESFTIGGISVFPSNLTNAILSNERAVIAADGGPSRVEAINVELMGHDLGILGRVMVVARIPAGVREFSAAAGRAASGDKSKS